MKSLKLLPSLIFMTFALIKCSSNSTDDLTDLKLSENVKYTTDVKPIIENSCIACHDAALSVGPIPLTNSSEVKFAIENLNLLGRINNLNAPMPPTGLMPKAQRDILEKWKNSGFLE